MIRLLAALLVALLFSTVPGSAQITQPSAKTTKLYSIAATSTQVLLNSPSSFFTIVNPSTTATIYISFVSPATITSGPILPGAAYSYSGSALNRFFAITSSGTVSVGVIAH